ncbi:MAG TPA: glycoside hydrolase family 3 N-terminal domain-containing protein [Ignavibacteria bacterium]|nr:glycoside hydrolase family 3 N-terminal domain-containing protein [Ignavibacteria bacterium]
MRKIFTPVILLISLMLIIFSSAETSNLRSAELIKTKQVSDNFFGLDNSDNTWVANKLASMTLREKIAQMIISYSDGFLVNESSSEFKRMSNLIENEKVGGFIFFKGNSVEEAKLINMLQEMSETPLLMSADFERGTKMRLNDGSLFPNNMALGATGNTDLAYQMGLQIAKECRAIGIHQNYAPVLDINNNPDNPIINVRSYGEDPLLVSKLGLSFIQGMQEGGVIATAKHFPGHGDTDIDSHSDLPVLNFSRERLDNLELIPFQNAVDAGVMSVMIAHLSLPSIDDEAFLPASLSEKIIDDLLIRQMGFKGLVVTDALNMAGIVKHFSTEDVALRCVDAGVDLILMPQGETTTISTIENAVTNGSISEERIDRSVKKILDAKNWLKLHENKYSEPSEVLNIVNSSSAKKISQDIADESITLVKNEGSILPFQNISDKTCLIISLNNGNENANSNLFASQFEANNKFKESYFYDLSGEISNKDELIFEAENSDIILVPIYAKVKINTGTVGLPDSQISLINSLIATGKKVIVISFGNPYLIKGFPDVDSYVCAYADAESTIISAINALNGIIKFKGKLPVSISQEFKLGHGITN